MLFSTKKELQITTMENNVNPNSNPSNQLPINPYYSSPTIPQPQKKKISSLTFAIIGLVIILIIAIATSILFSPNNSTKTEIADTEIKTEENSEQELENTANDETEVNIEEIFPGSSASDQNQQSLEELEAIATQEGTIESDLDEPISANYGVENDSHNQKYSTIIIEESILNNYSNRQKNLLEETLSNYFSFAHPDIPSLTLKNTESDNSFTLSSESGRTFLVEIKDEEITIFSSSKQELLSYDNRFLIETPESDAEEQAYFESLFEDFNEEE